MTGVTFRQILPAQPRLSDGKPTRIAGSARPEDRKRRGSSVLDYLIRRAAITGPDWTDQRRTSSRPRTSRSLVRGREAFCRAGQYRGRGSQPKVAARGRQDDRHSPSVTCRSCVALASLPAGQAARSRSRGLARRGRRWSRAGRRHAEYRDTRCPAPTRRAARACASASRPGLIMLTRSFAGPPGGTSLSGPVTWTADPSARIRWVRPAAMPTMSTGRQATAVVIPHGARVTPASVSR
jgi:hypothetical protein